MYETHSVKMEAGMVAGVFAFLMPCYLPWKACLALESCIVIVQELGNRVIFF